MITNKTEELLAEIRDLLTELVIPARAEHQLHLHFARPGKAATSERDSGTPLERFGLAVKAARMARGWSQEALAEVLPVGGQSGVARIESGVRPTNLDEIVEISSLLGLDAREFVA